VRAWQAIYGTLPCHVTFLVEGEEEIGSPHLAEFAAAHQELVSGDACLWEAGYHDAQGALNLYAGVKGILYVELRVRSAAYDLHSSNAPLAPNAAWRLIEALNAIREVSGRVNIPHFYDDVQPPTTAERELMVRFPVNEAAIQRDWGLNEILTGDPQHPLVPGVITATERWLFEPTCNICGFWSGYSGEGSKTIVPANAGVKIDFRLVPQQDPQTILASLRQYLADKGFIDVEVIEVEDAEKPAQSAVDTPLMEALIRSARTIYGIEPNVLPRNAGTGPMEQLCQRYGIPAIGGAGVGHPNARIHAPDENINLTDFILGIKHIAALLAEFA
jgi:acetylornithine deacetylase/succinyl-diaminopimelate desuccinylase-like protein